MHLLATTSGAIDGNSEAIDLKQTPGDVIFISAADSELALLAQAHSRLSGMTFELRLANLLLLQHHLSVDLYAERVIGHARLVVVRLLGGRAYWPYGLEQLAATARNAAIPFVVLPGDSRPDPELMSQSTIPAADGERMWRYLTESGPVNAENFLRYCAYLLGDAPCPPPPVVLARAGQYRAAGARHWPLAVILFYRSVAEGGQTAPIDSLIAALEERQVRSRAIFVASLKDVECDAFVRRTIKEDLPQLIINLTSFAITSADAADPLQDADCPVLQAILATSSYANWLASAVGLGPRDLAMGVVLPEVDGRVLTRAISFKSDGRWDERTQCAIVSYESAPDRVAYVADLACSWITLQRTSLRDRKVAIVLANYPNRDGRVGNGVGYDTPQSTITLLRALAAAGYYTGTIPGDGHQLMEILLSGPTNSPRMKTSSCTLDIRAYRRTFATLPDTLQQQINERWGLPESDPFFRQGAFRLPVTAFGNVVVGIQPARGYNIDAKATYHDPALVPPHGYLAFYFWLRHEFGAQAIVHNGKHGNLEWLPGKAISLSKECWPEAILGPTPQLYPFIVNDPGEGTQAKRRTSAVIIGHMTPPLTRAETYGPLKDLEALVDEYYLASGLDPRRTKALMTDILELSQHHRLDVDAGFTGDSAVDLKKLDAYLCDLKEAQIRNGLHVLGMSPEGREETDLLVALLRVPRRLGVGRDASLHRALATSLGLGDFDPLTCQMAEEWSGAKPGLLSSCVQTPWRTNGDAVERLEHLASQLVELGAAGASELLQSAGVTASEELQAVLDHLERDVRPALRSCGPAEIEAALNGLAGRPVRPGPSGAPTRGRLDVLPTGRNFYSLDNRSVPTPAAWALGKASAEELLKRHFQDFGCFPRSLGISAWGTSNMRTGGDDIAQVLAFVGVKPRWDPASWRVTGYEVIPVALLGRPRVDVTLRISGFFRDAFPGQIELIDKALRTVGALDEDENENPIAARMRRESQTLLRSGVSPDLATELAGARIFGSKPGAYGAGLQALIDEKLWSKRAELADAYITWGAYAYGSRLQGAFDGELFRRRLASIEAVVHNQDNREHDLLDSDDYYQFEGGMAAAVEDASGRLPTVYHNDHSRPERPVIRTLEEEVGRVVRSRVVNPKWIAGVRRHGYKGAFEIAATVDYMFAFAATTGAVKSHHFDLAFEAFIGDPEVREFIRQSNPAALREIGQRFDEAAARGLWLPRANSAHDVLREIVR
jgi:cobaltochelatase CobN